MGTAEPSESGGPAPRNDLPPDESSRGAGPQPADTTPGTDGPSASGPGDSRYGGPAGGVTGAPAAAPYEPAAADGVPATTRKPVPGAGAAPADRATAPPPQLKIERTRTGALWVAVAAAALVLLFLLIFILQNSQQVKVSFLGTHGMLSLGLAMLFSAVAGALLVVLVGTARIVQLRLVARRHRGQDAANRTP